MHASTAQLNNPEGYTFHSLQSALWQFERLENQDSNFLRLADQSEAAEVLAQQRHGNIHRNI